MKKQNKPSTGIKINSDGHSNANDNIVIGHDNGIEAKMKSGDVSGNMIAGKPTDEKGWLKPAIVTLVILIVGTVIALSLYDFYAKPALESLQKPAQESSQEKN